MRRKHHTDFDFRYGKVREESNDFQHKSEKSY